MQAAPPELGPFFAHVKHQSHPSPKLLDLGIQMRWGAPRHSARLYRNLRDHAPYAFGFDDVVIHEEDAIEDFDYQPSYARRTAVGTFYPLSAFIAALYERGRANRDIFTALAELDRLLPAERPVTSRDIVNFCQSLGEAAGRAGCVRGNRSTVGCDGPCFEANGPLLPSGGRRRGLQAARLPEGRPR